MPPASERSCGRKGRRSPPSRRAKSRRTSICGAGQGSRAPRSGGKRLVWCEIEGEELALRRRSLCSRQPDQGRLNCSRFWPSVGSFAAEIAHGFCQSQGTEASQVSVSLRDLAAHFVRYLERRLQLFGLESRETGFSRFKIVKPLFPATYRRVSKGS